MKLVVLDTESRIVLQSGEIRDSLLEVQEIRDSFAKQFEQM